MKKLSRRQGSNKMRFSLILATIAVLGFFVFATFLKLPSSSDKVISPKSTLVNSKVAVSPSPTPTSTPTPTPTPIMTPTPTPTPAGFCLNVPVIFYHHIQPLGAAKEHGNTALTVDNSIFDTQMQYLSTHGYTTIPAKQLVNALKTHTALPPKSIVVTLDDGYLDNYTYAYPIFQKYRINANIMLATGLMGGSDYLTWEQVKEMGQSGLVSYTDHTWSHYAVSQGPTDKIQYEILTAKQQIESNTGQVIDTFTYPYGAFNDRAIALLKQDGFNGAFTTLAGTFQCDSFIMTLHRTRIGNTSLSSYGF